MGKALARRAYATTLAIVLIVHCAAGQVEVAAAKNGAGGPDMPAYSLHVTFDDATRTLDGSLAVDWPNATGEPQAMLFFRLYPNADYYGAGQTTVSAVRVDGGAAMFALRQDATVLQVDLETAIADGAHAHIELDFVTTIPETSDASFGIFGGNAERGWSLADWHPILAGWEDGNGWYLDPPTRFGDPTFAESSTWELRLTTPAGLAVIGSGVEQQVETEAGTAVTRIVAGPGRDLTLTLLPELDDVEVTGRAAGGVEISVILPAGMAAPGLGEAIGEVAAASLPLFETWMGEYHDAELDVVAVPLAGAPAVAWNGLIWLDLDGIAADGVFDAGEADRLRFVLLHELAHLWIPGIVGSNNNDHGFMGEGLANALAILAGRELFGVEVAETWLRERVAAGYLAMVEAGEDGVADAPIANDSDAGDRARLVYGKAALGFEAIRQAIGDDAFFAGLQAYATMFRFGISEPSDLRAAWEDASGMDLTAMWRDWFEDDVTTVADVHAVLDGFA
jgi:hypothetical protein